MFRPPLDLEQVKGFLRPPEAEALYHAARERAACGPVLEIGSYCGKSTVCLAAACSELGGLLYALDHHRGSEEHQPGQPFHDPELFDCDARRLDSFGAFRRTLRQAGLEDAVVPIVAGSEQAARYWNTALSMLFIDGGHSLDAALGDYRRWVGHLQRNGILAIHDVFADASEGGHAPYAIFRLALASGLFEELRRVESLALLRRL